MGNLDVIAEELEGVHRYDGYLVALCPFHDDHRPSFFVYSDFYRCLSCGVWGRTDKLLARLSKVPPTPKRHINVDLHFNNPFQLWTLIYGNLTQALKSAHQFIKTRPSIYLRERKIDHETQIKLRIGYMDGWYTFPIHNADGIIVGAVARKDENNPSQAKYVIPKGQNPNLLYCPSWQRVLSNNNLFVTYGIIDAISLYICGVASCSTTTGKLTNPQAFEHIRKKILIWPDRGEEQEALELASKLGWRGKMLKVNWPENTKDVNEIMVKDENYLKRQLEKFI